MKRFVLLPLLMFVFSCASEQPKTKSDSVVADTLKTATLNYDSIVNDKGVPELLMHLPTLSFPLILEVDSFEKKHGIAIKLQNNLPWFADFLEFREGTKVTALGKFAPDANTDAILYFLSSPNDYPERPDDVELIVTLINKKTGDLDSRILAIASENFGRTIMKSASEGKSYVWEENDEVNLSFDSFTITGSEFVRGESEDKKFPGDNNGKADAQAAVMDWMK